MLPSLLYAESMALSLCRLTENIAETYYSACRNTVTIRAQGETVHVHAILSRQQAQAEDAVRMATCSFRTALSHDSQRNRTKSDRPCRRHGNQVDPTDRCRNGEVRGACDGFQRSNPRMGWLAHPHIPHQQYAKRGSGSADRSIHSKHRGPRSAARLLTSMTQALQSLFLATLPPQVLATPAVCVQSQCIEVAQSCRIRCSSCLVPVPYCMLFDLRQPCQLHCHKLSCRALALHTHKGRRHGTAADGGARKPELLI